MNHIETIVFAIVLIILIMLAGFFSCAETALMAVNRYRLRHKARMKKKDAIQLLKLLKHPDQLLSAILIGSTFTNMLASSLATLLAYHFFGDEGAIFSAVFLTFIVLIFAEIIPKTIAAFYSEKVAKGVLHPIRFIMIVLYPLIWLANHMTRSILHLLDIRIMPQSVEPLSREELRSIVYDTSGKISQQYQNMLLGILDLSKLTVDDVMIPRHDIIGIDISQSFVSIMEQLHHSSQGFVPVYRDDINQVMGVLYTRDVLRFFMMQQKPDKELLQQFIQAPYFVPEGTALTVQLAYFKRSQDKMAFVVDEYGEVMGLLTLNDILEEIIGDFTPQMSVDKRVESQKDGSYLTDGSITIREFNRMSQFDLPQRGGRTINGLITEYLEALPHAGTTVLIADYPIEIIHVKENRVVLARIFPKLQSRE